MPKSKQKNNHKNTVPVFRIKPDGRTGGIIKHVGNLLESEKLLDEPVEFNPPQHSEARFVGKNAIEMKDIGDFTMTARMYRCNIVASHIVTSNRYPVMYIDVSYEKPMVSGSLFQIFASIDMHPEEKKKIQDKKEYVGLKFNGEWYIHIDCDDELKENYEQLLCEKLGCDNNDARIEKYREIINSKKYDYRSTDKLRDDMLALAKSEEFDNLVIVAMKCRELHRRNKYGLTDESSYVVPDNVTKLSDISQKMIEDDEIILDDE